MFAMALSLGGVSVPRLMLHARQLTFPHPDGRGEFTLEAPVPDDMAQLCREVGLDRP